jgi:PPOX class probable F420-dependent enzyme
MTAELTEEDVALLREAQLAQVSTLMANGTPHITPVWVDTDGQAVLFNTARGRVKAKNLERNPAIAVCVVDRANDHRWVSVRGRAELIDEGADAHIDRLAKKYLGVDSYPFWTEGERRVTVRVVPEHRFGEP